jgi:hypothetical protein
MERGEKKTVECSPLHRRGAGGEVLRREILLFIFSRTPYIQSRAIFSKLKK